MQPPDKPFDEPWQAQAFALVVALNEAGHLPWDQWANAFSASLAASSADAADQASAQLLPGDAKTNAAYWRAWLQTLEQLMRERGIAAPLQLTAHREAVRAYNGAAARTKMFRLAD